MNTASLQPAELGRLLQGKTAQRVILAINVLLVIWIATRLAALTWGLLPQQQEEPAQPVIAATGNIPAKPDPDRMLVRQLSGWHLMGEVTVAAEPVKIAAPVDAPDTQLNLTLKGSLASDDKVHARAIIADQRGQDEQYAIGATLPGNAELSAIYPDRVILQRNGRYETLRLPTDVQSGNVYSAAATPAAMRSTQSPAERLRAVRQQVQQQPANLARLLRISPANDPEGNLVGYTLAPGNDPQLFEQLGLQNGDVVTEVNGLALTDPQNSATALQSLQSGEPVTLKLMRDGVEQDLSLDGYE